MPERRSPDCYGRSRPGLSRRGEEASTHKQSAGYRRRHDDDQLRRQPRRPHDPRWKRISNKDLELNRSQDQSKQMRCWAQVNQKFTAMCLDDAAVEAGIVQEKQDDPEARLEVHQKFAEMCLDTAVGTDINQEKQSDQEARSEADQKPAETIRQCTVVEANVKPEAQAPANPGVIYRCKKCRRMVATQEYVVTHDVGLGEAGFLRRRNDHADEKKPECSACIFVEPMKWMQAVEEGYVSNKLWCMGCKTRLGSFDWAGMQCCCGAWVIPAFQLLKSRIDESHM